MLRSPMDVPCRTCGVEAGQPCRYAFNDGRMHMLMPGYHGDRKYVDFVEARRAYEALTNA